MMSALRFATIERDTAQDTLEQPRSPQNRRTIQDAFNRAAQGLKPLQPHDDPKVLLAEAWHGQVYLRELGRILSAKLKYSEFEMGPAKDMKRAQDKMTRKGRLLSENCDFARAREFTDVEQMKSMIDLFGSRTDDNGIVISHKGESITIYVMDVDNTFSIPNQAKPGLRNLDAKLMVTFRLKNGEETYHIAEFQSILNSMKEAWDESHLHAENERLHNDRLDGIELAMAGLHINEHDKLVGLIEEFTEVTRVRNEASRLREKTNVIAARQCNADALTGYQPCNNNNPEKLALIP